MTILKQTEFWLMIAAMTAHSLSTTSWSSYSVFAWFVGMLLIWALYGMCRLEAHRKKVQTDVERSHMHVFGHGADAAVHERND